jgi:hypothetical protein
MNSISMNTRPRLNFGDEKLQQIAVGLSQSGLNRTAFVNDPIAYLSAQGLDLSSANFVIGDIPNRTSEVCTVVALCAAFAAIAVLAVQSLAAGFYYAIAAAVYYAYAVQTAVYTNTSLYSSGASFNNPSHLAYHNVGGHLL